MSENSTCVEQPDPRRTVYPIFGLLCAFAVLVIGSTAGLISWGWQIHIAQPHPGAVREHSYRADLDRIEARLTRIEDKFDQRHAGDSDGQSGLVAKPFREGAGL